MNDKYRVIYIVCPLYKNERGHLSQLSDHMLFQVPKYFRERKTHRHSTFQISIILRILVSSYKQFVYRKTLFYYRYLKRRMLVIETGACASCIYNRLMTANGSFMDILCTSRENTGYVSTCYLQYTIVCTYISFLF